MLPARGSCLPALGQRAVTGVGPQADPASTAGQHYERLTSHMVVVPGAASAPPAGPCSMQGPEVGATCRAVCAHGLWWQFHPSLTTGPPSHAATHNTSESTSDSLVGQANGAIGVWRCTAACARSWRCCRSPGVVWVCSACTGTMQTGGGLPKQLMSVCRRAASAWWCSWCGGVVVFPQLQQHHLDTDAAPAWGVRITQQVATRA
jgi:hypothetical protein